MKQRGTVFRDWLDPGLQHQGHNETLSDGTEIDVQVRLSRIGGTQLFIGVYPLSGPAIHEESFDSRPGQSTSRALVWGIGRARQVATDEVDITRRVVDRSR